MMFGVPRSPHWPRVRDEFLAKEPYCQVCKSRKNLNVHHKKPYHLFPDMELDPNNLITLCEGGPVNCHLLFGHLFNWSDYNPHVQEDADAWRDKIASRLKGAIPEAVPFMQES